jgi:flagellar hook-length control protein FliK
MDNNLNFSTSTIANPLSSAAPAAATAVDDSLSTPMNGKEFAGLMRDLLNNSGRQELAASGEEGLGKEPGAATAVACDSSLQTLNLGDQFAVITTASPLPDANSLAAFARAQGLGDSAVKALFGDLVSMPVTTDPLKLSSPALSSIELGSVLTAPSFGWETLAPTGIASQSGMHISSVSAVSQDTNLLANPATLSWLSMHPNALPLNGQVAPTALPLSRQTAVSVLSEATELTQGIAHTASLNTNKASDLNNLLGAVGATAVVQTFGVAPTTAEMAAEIPPEMGPLDAMRMRLVPQWETMTKQLAKLNGNLQSSTWAEIMMGKLAEKESGLPSNGTLDLGSTDIGLDLGADLALAMAAGADDNVSAMPLNATDNTKAPVSLSALANSSISAQGDKGQLADRAEQIQALANKLGHELGERLQEQMERGQWRLHLKLNPGHLGQIDVELDMHAGGLDAIFKTDNMLTKELITQGMSRLKDSLAQSGTAVADVWVNSESKRESGGNPTPQRFSGNTESETPDDAAQPVQQASRIIEKRSADAWDTLA